MNGPPASLPDQLLVPSDRLRARLSSGIRASLIAGGLMAGASLAEAISGDPPGLTSARVLNLVSLVPTLGIVRAYAALAREAGRPSLGRGAWSVLGTTALVLLIDLGEQDVLPESGRALLWLVVAIGLILLPVLPFLPDRKTSALVTAAVLTWAAQAMLAARAFAGIIGEIGVDGEATASVVAAFLVVGSFLWFGAIKVRARRALGGIAALLGWSEILGVLAMILWVIVGYGIALGLSVNAGEAEPSDKLMASLDDQMGRVIAVIGLLVGLAWTAMTVWFFLSIRRRGRGGIRGATGRESRADCV